MCLSVPGKIISIDKDNAILDYISEKRNAKIVDGDFKVGDYAIVQGKIVVMKVEENEAKEALDAYNKALE